MTITEFWSEYTSTTEYIASENMLELLPLILGVIIAMLCVWGLFYGLTRLFKKKKLNF